MQIIKNIVNFLSFIAKLQYSAQIQFLYILLSTSAQIHVPSSFVVKFCSIFGTISYSFILDCQVKLYNISAQIHVHLYFVVKVYSIFFLAQIHVPLSFAVKTMVFWHKFEYLYLLLSNFSI